MTSEPEQRERESQEPERRELFAIYQLHADLADRVSQRREGANRLFVSLLTGLLVFGAVFLRFGTGDLEANAVMACFGIVGALLSIAWFAVIRSYRQLNTGKFQALQELEGKLAYPFFRREWELLGEGRDRSRYWKLTVAETLLPIVFGLLFLGILLFIILR